MLIEFRLSLIDFHTHFILVAGHCGYCALSIFRSVPRSSEGKTITFNCNYCKETLYYRIPHRHEVLENPEKYGYDEGDHDALIDEEWALHEEEIEESLSDDEEY